jgi:hypothetical protein
MITFAAYGIVIAAFFAFWHLLYENIFAPELRNEERYKLFEIRDRLRRFKIENNELLDNEAFLILDRNLSYRIDNLANVTIVSLMKVSFEYHHNADFRKHVNDRLAVLERCKHQDYKDIRSEITSQFVRLLDINHGAWAPLFFVTRTISRWMRWLTKNIKRMLVIPENEQEVIDGQPACC